MSFQCILTRTDHELFYTGENAAGIAHSQSLTCPFCGKLGFTEATLVDHVSSAHTDSSHDSQEVICPICASTPGDDPNYFVSRSDFSTHINLDEPNYFVSQSDFSTHINLEHSRYCFRTDRDYQ